MISKSLETIEDKSLFCIVELKTTAKTKFGSFEGKIYIKTFDIIDNKLVVKRVSDIPVPLDFNTLKLYFRAIEGKDVNEVETQIEKLIDNHFVNPNSPLRKKCAEILKIDTMDIHMYETTLICDDSIVLFDGLDVLGSSLVKRESVIMYVDPETQVKQFVCGSHFDPVTTGDLYFVDPTEINTEIQMFRFGVVSPAPHTLVYRNPLIKAGLNTETRDKLLNPNNWVVIEIVSFSTVENVSTVQQQCIELTEPR